MNEKIILAVLTVISAGYITHKFTKRRFKEELRVKKNEKNINDVKELINDFEEKLSERIFLTRGYLFDILEKNVSPESRENYKKVILKWNIDFDYRSNRLSRFGFLSQIKEIDNLQSELKSFHSFLAKNVTKLESVNKIDVMNEIDKLRKFQTRAYKFITKLHKDADNQWDRIFFEKVSLRKELANYIFDCLFKTIVTYLSITLFLFLATVFFR